MLIHRAKQHGMTLIEIMIAIVIAGILMMMGAPSFNQMIQNARTRTAAEAIQNGFQLARVEAVKRNSTAYVELCGLPDSSWQVVATLAGAPAVQSVVCPGTAPNIGEERVQERSGQEGSRGVTVTVTPAGATRLTFNGIGRVTSNSDASAAITQVDVANPNGNRPLRITVSAAGSVRMCDPALASTDPQGC